MITVIDRSRFHNFDKRDLRYGSIIYSIKKALKLIEGLDKEFSKDIIPFRTFNTYGKRIPRYICTNITLIIYLRDISNVLDSEVDSIHRTFLYIYTLLKPQQGYSVSGSRKQTPLLFP